MSAPPTVLLVDDDPTLLDLLAHQFDNAGYRTIAASDGEQGLELFRHHRPDLVIADVMMPNMDGWDVCRQVRENSDTPVILLSARTMELDKLNGFRLGADDYVTKPFSVAELVARARAVLARYERTGVKSDIVSTGDLSISFRERAVTVAGEKVELTPTEYRLLETLARHLGEPVATDTLLVEVWGPGYAGENDLVKHFIWSLRRKLEADPRAPRHLVTARGFGYRLHGTATSAHQTDTY